MEFSTDSMKEHFPVLYDKIGGSKDLNMELSWKDVRVLLGNYDADVILEYTMQLTLFEHETIELIYDEFRVITAVDFWTESDILHAHFINWKLDTDSIRYASDKLINHLVLVLNLKLKHLRHQNQNQQIGKLINLLNQNRKNKKLKRLVLNHHNNQKDHNNKKSRD